MMKRTIVSLKQKFLKLKGRRNHSYSSSSSSSSLTSIKNHEQVMRQYLHTSGAISSSISSSKGINYGPVKIRAERIIYDTNSNNNNNNTKNGGREEMNATNSKIIHFQRHGQGYHNLLYLVLKENGICSESIYSKDPKTNPFVRNEIIDSPLTELGREQCMNQRLKYASSTGNNNSSINNNTGRLLNPELVIVSPLHRAIQTAQITFQEFITTNNNVPFIAHEMCREELGLLTCNKRRPINETRREFPNIDFSLCDNNNSSSVDDEYDDEDPLWDPNKRECPRDKSKRIYDFLVNFVRHRPEREIAIVGHSAWLFNMTNAVVDCGDDEDLISWFATAEIRSMKITWEDD